MALLGTASCALGAATAACPTAALEGPCQPWGAQGGEGDSPSSG